MDTNRITLTWRERTAIVTINRPERRNALDQTMWYALRDLVDEAAGKKPDALILTGEGGHFCAGADLGLDNPLIHRIMPAMVQQRREPALEVLGELKDIVNRFSRFPAPTIAAVEGICMGGGLELALACDIRVVSRTATLAFPEVRVGFIPDLGGTARLTRLLGPGRAATYILSGRRMNGETAFLLGLADVEAEPGTALDEALALVCEMGQGGPRALALTLDLIRRIPDLPNLQAALDAETEAAVEAMTSGEVQVGVTAFLKKEPPSWLTR